MAQRQIYSSSLSGSLSVPLSDGRTTAQVDDQQRPQGEFIMSGDLTRLGRSSDPVREPANSAAVMPDFSNRRR